MSWGQTGLHSITLSQNKQVKKLTKQTACWWVTFLMEICLLAPRELDMRNDPG